MCLDEYFFIIEITSVNFNECQWKNGYNMYNSRSGVFLNEMPEFKGEY
jgi:hypothetical protein